MENENQDLICKYVEIPYEMQLEVMRHLPIDSLLQFRLVSRSWNDAALSLCRRRDILFKNDWSLDSPVHWNRLFSTFEHQARVPWSFCWIVIWQEPCKQKGEFFDSMKKDQIRQFFQTFGRHIRHLEVIVQGDEVTDELGDTNSLITILKSAPFLEELDLELSLNDTNMSFGWTVSFNFLRRLRISLETPEEFKFLECLLKQSGIGATRLNLDSISVRFHDWDPFFPIDMKEVAALIVHIPRISLIISRYASCEMSNWRKLTEVGVKVCDLYFTLEEGTPRDPNFWQPLEDFLSSTSQTLESLGITFKPSGNCKRGELPHLGIPFLSKLKQISFYTDAGTTPIQFVILKPFKANQFPNLKKISVAKNADIYRLFHANAPFSSVTNLSTSFDPGEDEIEDWNHVFPHLEQFYAHFDTSKQKLEYIFEKMRHLKGLLLTTKRIKGAGGYSYDPYSIISAYPTLSNDEVFSSTSKNVQTLSSMKGLRTLELNFGPCGEFQLPDPAVHLLLLQLQPLDILRIQGIQIPDKYNALLAAYHISFCNYFEAE